MDSMLLPSAHRAVELITAGAGTAGELLDLLVGALDELLVVQKDIALEVNRDRLDIFCGVLELYDEVHQLAIARSREVIASAPAELVSEVANRLRRSVLFQELVAFDTYLALVPQDAEKQDKAEKITETVKGVVKSFLDEFLKFVLDMVDELLELLKGKGKKK